MPKVTSKLQVTVPTAIADEYRIRPGDEIRWVAAGDTIRVIPPALQRHALGVEEKLALFDQATVRQRRREEQACSPESERGADRRDWTRDDLYEDRVRPR